MTVSFVFMAPSTVIIAGSESNVGGSSLPFDLDPRGLSDTLDDRIRLLFSDAISSSLPPRDLALGDGGCKICSRLAAERAVVEGIELG